MGINISVKGGRVVISELTIKITAKGVKFMVISIT